MALAATFFKEDFQAFDSSEGSNIASFDFALPIEDRSEV